MSSGVCRAVVFLTVAALAAASEVKPAFWKGTPLDAHVEKMRSSCEASDTIACFQFKAFSFLDSVLKGGYFQFSDIEVSRNNHQLSETTARSEDSIEAGVEDFLKTHDVTFKVPQLGDVKVDSRSLDNEEINLKLNFGDDDEFEGRRKKFKIKKHKVKKILIPIVVFLLLKAMTLVPLAIGILGLKAWNGLQLAFFSFVISAGLAIFQLFQKLAADGAHAHISTAGWEPSAHIIAKRSADAAQMLAYGAYRN
nr:unnamed protein product [Callosobruchus chinensis]